MSVRNTLIRGLGPLYSVDTTNESQIQDCWSVTLRLITEQPMTKDVVDVQFNKQYIRAGVKGQRPIIQGEVWSLLDVDQCTWQIDEDGIVELTLQKERDVPWPLPVIIRQGVDGDEDKLDPQSRFFLGGMSLQLGDEAAEQKAIAHWKISAEQHYYPSERMLASVYSTNAHLQLKSVQKNDTESLKYVRIAADRGVADAQFVLSHALENGFGGAERNHEESMRLLREAAEGNHPAALHECGMRLRDGVGLETDKEKGIEFLKQAAITHGEASSVFELGRSYLYGNGLEVNLDKAEEMIRIALKDRPEQLERVANNELSEIKKRKMQASEGASADTKSLATDAPSSGDKNSSSSTGQQSSLSTSTEQVAGKPSKATSSTASKKQNTKPVGSDSSSSWLAGAVVVAAVAAVAYWAIRRSG